MKIGVLLKHSFMQSLLREVFDFRQDLEIFLILLFSNACCSDRKSPETVAGAVAYLPTASICESDDLRF